MQSLTKSYMIIPWQLGLIGAADQMPNQLEHSGELLDMWTEECNRLFKTVVKDVEEQRSRIAWQSAGTKAGETIETYGDMAAGRASE